MQEKVTKRELCINRVFSPVENLKKQLLPPRSTQSSIKKYYSNPDSPNNISRSTTLTPTSLISAIEKQLQRLNKSIKISEKSNTLHHLTQTIDNILNHTCQNCADRVITIETLRKELKSQQESASAEMEKIFEMKKQLKKYESLLKQREKNLELCNANFLEEKKTFEKKEKELNESREKVEKDRIFIEAEFLKVNDEKIKLNQQIRKFDNKYIDVNRQFVASPDGKKKELRLDENFFNEVKVKSQVLSMVSMELSKKEEKLIEREGEIERKRKEMDEREKEIDRIFEGKVKNIGIVETKLKGQKKEMKQKLEELTKELANLENIRQSMGKSKIKSVAKTVSTQSEVLVISLEGKEKELETIHKKLMIFQEKLEEKDQKLLQREKNYENFMSLIEDSENLRMESEELRIIIKNKDAEHKTTEEIYFILQQIEEKTISCQQKEKDLLELQYFINEEKQEIEKTAEILEKINSELELQKENLEKEKNQIQEEKLANAYFFQQEANSLQKKEKDLEIRFSSIKA